MTEEERRLKREKILIEKEILNEERLTEEEARTVLEDPTLFDYIIKEELSKKIVGEKSTCHTIFLIANGRLVENANMTSYNLLVNDETGTGKDWVTTRVLEIIPKEQWVKRTRISEKIFTYWHNPRFEPEWTWDGKIFYNEDISNPVLNSDVFKVMASSGSHATVLIKQVPVDIKIEGKPVMVATTAESTPNPENVRRFTILNLDSSIDQTKEILKRQIEYAKKGKNIDYSLAVIEAQKYLKRVKVKIPFNKELMFLMEKYVPTTHVLMRTIFERFLDYIKASCAFHQYQRETDELGFRLAESQDYNIARTSILKTTTNQLMIPLTRDQRKILDIMKGFNGLTTIEDIASKVTFMSERWLRGQLNKLANYGFIKKDVVIKEGSDKKVLAYEHVEIFDFDIPTWERLEKELKQLKT